MRRKRVRNTFAIKAGDRASNSSGLGVSQMVHLEVKKHSVVCRAALHVAQNIICSAQYESMQRRKKSAYFSSEILFTKVQALQLYSLGAGKTAERETENKEATSISDWTSENWLIGQGTLGSRCSRSGWLRRRRFLFLFCGQYLLPAVEFVSLNSVWQRVLFKRKTIVVWK